MFGIFTLRLRSVPTPITEGPSRHAEENQLSERPPFPEMAVSDGSESAPNDEGPESAEEMSQVSERFHDALKRLPLILGG